MGESGSLMKLRLLLILAFGLTTTFLSSCQIQKLNSSRGASNSLPEDFYKKFRKATKENEDTCNPSGQSIYFGLPQWRKAHNEGNALHKLAIVFHCMATRYNTRHEGSELEAKNYDLSEDEFYRPLALKYWDLTKEQIAASGFLFRSAGTLPPEFELLHSNSPNHVRIFAHPFHPDFGESNLKKHFGEGTKSGALAGLLPSGRTVMVMPPGKDSQPFFLKFDLSALKRPLHFEEMANEVSMSEWMSSREVSHSAVYAHEVQIPPEIEPSEREKKYRKNYGMQMMVRRFIPSNLNPQKTRLALPLHSVLTRSFSASTEGQRLFKGQPLSLGRTGWMKRVFTPLYAKNQFRQLFERGVQLANHAQNINVFVQEGPDGDEVKLGYQDFGWFKFDPLLALHGSDSFPPVNNSLYLNDVRNHKGETSFASEIYEGIIGRLEGNRGSIVMNERNIYGRLGFIQGFLDDLQNQLRNQLKAHFKSELSREISSHPLVRSSLKAKGSASVRIGHLRDAAVLASFLEKRGQLSLTASELTGAFINTVISSTTTQKRMLATLGCFEGSAAELQEAASEFTTHTKIKVSPGSLFESYSHKGWDFYLEKNAKRGKPTCLLYSPSDEI